MKTDLESVESPAGKPGRPSHGRVLIVEPEGMVRTVMRCILESWGFVAHTTCTLRGAGQALDSAGPFHAVVCAYQLPDGNAYHLVASMRQRQLVVPTIVTFDAPRPAPQTDADVELLVRPFDSMILKSMLERMLGMSPVCDGAEPKTVDGVILPAPVAITRSGEDERTIRDTSSATGT